MSQVQDLVAVYRSLAARCDYALHLGLTEAGMGSKGIVASSAAMGILLQQGIAVADTAASTTAPTTQAADETRFLRFVGDGGLRVEWLFSVFTRPRLAAHRPHSQAHTIRSEL